MDIVKTQFNNNFKNAFVLAGFDRTIFIGWLLDRLYVSYRIGEWLFCDTYRAYMVLCYRLCVKWWNRILLEHYLFLSIVVTSITEKCVQVLFENSVHYILP